MNAADIFKKLRAYPVVSVSVLAAVVSIAVMALHLEDAQALADERASAIKELEDMRANQRAADGLAADTARAKSLREKALSRALNIDSMIEVQAFLTGVLGGARVKSEGLPVPNATPVAGKAIKELATRDYTLLAGGDYFSVLSFSSGLIADAEHPVALTRLVLVAPEDSAKSSELKSDIGFSVWGRRGELPAASPRPDTRVISPELRRKILEAGEAAASPKRFDHTGVADPFITIAPSSNDRKDAPKIDPGVALEAALAALKFSVRPLVGVPAIFVVEPSQLPRRVGDELEIITAEGVRRVRVTGIEGESFTVVTPFGKKIKINPHP